MTRAIVVGVSAGGIQALSTILPTLSADFSFPIVIVQHRLHDDNDFLVEHLNKLCSIHVKEASLREHIEPGCVYFSPSGYHLLIERTKQFSLSVDLPVHFAIPSIDVLFQSAANAYGNGLVGIVLTGANADGSDGLKSIKDQGGLTLVQDPQTADSPEMPRAAIEKVSVDHVLSLEEIGPFLMQLHKKGGDHG